MYEPKGVTLILGPWNYPFMLTMAPLAASLAAGNSAIVKLSDFTMNTSNIAAKVIRDAFDEKEVAIFEGEVEVATELLDQPFDHIFFTGSTNVGKIVMTAAAKHLASVTLELGGKSPTIIDSEYDLMDAAKKIAVGKFVNAGQTCIAPDYLFIKKDVQDRFAGILQTVVNAGFMEDDHTQTAANLRRSSMTATSTASKICSTMPSKEGRKWCSAAYSMPATARSRQPF